MHDTVHHTCTYLHVHVHVAHSPLGHKATELSRELALVQQGRRSVHNVGEEGKLRVESLLGVGGAPCR